MDLDRLAAETRRAARDALTRRKLARAGIFGEALPENFDGAALCDDLESLSLRHTVRETGRNPFARVADANAVQEVHKAALALKAALNALQGDAREKARWELAEAMGEERIPSIQQVNDLADAAKRAEKRLRILAAEGAAFPVPPGGETALQRLIAVDLPALFQNHFKRPCGIGIEPAAEKPTEGLRFIVAAAAALGINIAPAAAAKMIQRHRKQSRAQEDMAP